MPISAQAITRPSAGEYAPYYDRYISLVSGNDILATLKSQGDSFSELFSGRSDPDGDYRYAPGKWSVKEVLGHINDAERVFTYRALRIARGDTTPIEGFEQDDYVHNGPFPLCRLSDLVQEFRDVRAATLSLFRNLQPEAWTRRGVANKNEIVVRAIPYIIAGHTNHHRRILEEKYFAVRAAAS